MAVSVQAIATFMGPALGTSLTLVHAFGDA